MTAREQELIARRAVLLSESARLRGAIGADSKDLMNSLSAVQRIAQVGRTMASRPLLVAGAAALVLLTGPRQALRLAGRALVVLGLLKRLLGLIGPSKP